MARLADVPIREELEDYVAAHLISRGVFVHTNAVARDPEDLFELDVVWTDYKTDPPFKSHPVEIKSGKNWGINDIFKFYGWTRYLELPAGQFIYSDPGDRLSPELIDHLAPRLGMKILHIEDPKDPSSVFASAGLSDPSYAFLPTVWRYSFQARRRLQLALKYAIDKKTAVETAKRAKDYAKLINDAVFFESDIRLRVKALLKAHFKHPKLAATCANEIVGNEVDFENPKNSQAFKDAMYRGKHFPVQSCLYLGHRGRLMVLKAAVDYWAAKQLGEIKSEVVKLGDFEIDFSEADLHGSFKDGLAELSTHSSFPLFPYFWQVFLFSWGGFILKDRRDEEHEALSEQTGVPVEDVPFALTAFDQLFPVNGGWIADVKAGAREVVKMMPQCLRGIGVFHRHHLYNVQHPDEIGLSGFAASHLVDDHNCGVRLLDCSKDDLAA